MTWLTLLSICITAVATCFIAYYSKVSTDLAEEIKNQEKNYRDNTKQHQSELRDLFQAIVISNLIGGHSTFEENKKKFELSYTGKVEIFKTEIKETTG